MPSPVVWPPGHCNGVGLRRRSAHFWRTCSWQNCLERTYPALKDAWSIRSGAATVARGSATALPFTDASISAIVVDPPYYDSVPYSDLSDFFYVWLKRSLGDVYPDLFRTPLTPKSQELIAYYGSGKRRIQKTPEWYEQEMRAAFREMQRVLGDGGIASVMFAHKTTTAWESLIAGLITFWPHRDSELALAHGNGDTPSCTECCCTGK